MSAVHERNSDQPSARMPEDMRHYVWMSDCIYHSRYQRGLDAATALVSVLADRPLLNGREIPFVDLYRRCMTLDGDVLSAVWLDPSAFGWAVYAYHSVGVLGALKADLAADKQHVRADHDRIEAALCEQLDYFKALAVGMHIAAGIDLELPAPLDVTLPFTIPGTRFVICGQERARIAGVRDAMPVLDGDGPVRVEEARLVTRHGCHFQLNSWCGQVPHIDCPEVGIAATFPAVIEPAHTQAIDRALDWIHLYAPDAFEVFRKWTRCLAVKQPQADGAGGVGSASFTFLPGLIHLKLVANPLWLAESFIHESQHNRLFFLDEDTHILREIPGPAVNYSPWRRDARPPHGILHAIAVFIPVTRFMLDICRAGVLQGEDQDYALDFVVRQRYRNRMALDVMEAVGDFTAAGCAVFDEIRRASEELDRDIVQAALPENGPALHLEKPSARFVPTCSERTGAPMTSIEALLEHIELYDAAGQAPAWRPVFERTLAQHATIAAPH
ncbi:MAG: HEXXH motif-containing putative peptide modification protein [Dongiaceae bacterium]